jgi:hypothetical protein
LRNFAADCGQSTAVDVADFITSHFSIDDAEGEQLDIVAGLIGIKRPPAQEEYLFQLYGEGEVGDPLRGFKDDSDPNVVIGGYLASQEGNPVDTGEMMDDVGLRRLIRQRAANFRRKMTIRNLFNYLIAFGARCKIDESTSRLTEIDLESPNDLDNFFRWYVVTKGFSPGGLKVRFKEPTRGDSPI